MSELIVDSFAGGGGASLGIAWATGRGPDIAINHDADALAMHAANHPSTQHVREDVWHTDLRKLIDERPVGLLWASPDCKHFSRAKGSKPVEKSIRSLAWVVVRWASQVRPRVIVLENVREFADWGPLVEREDGTFVPCKDRKGMTFRLFCNRLRGLGYQVEYRNMNAADYGAPTHRRRLFLIARCDGRPIEWPEPTHGDPKTLGDQPMFERLKPWRTAAECIDWSIECPSIFTRKKPLVEKTMRRIAMGMKRYVLSAESPFLVATNHGDSGGRRSYPLDEPMRSACKTSSEAIATPFLTKYHHAKSGEDRCHRVDEPVKTLDTQNRYGLVSAFLSKHFGGVVGVPIGTPFPTITGTPTQNQITAANLIRFNHGEKQWSDIEDPIGTITGGGNHFGLVYAFLVKYFGTAIGQPANQPLGTVTSKHRFGVVQVEVEPGRVEPAIALDVAGVGPCVIADIGMRMLQPRELARAQGFPDTYDLTGTKTNQVAKIGNSVCPQCAAAIVKANYATASKTSEVYA